VIRKVKARRRQLGFIPLNKPFPGSHGHHIDKERVIYMPAETHKTISHSVLRNRNIREINTAAYRFLSDNQSAHTLSNLMAFQAINL
jgi:hypothetical protein